MSRVRIPPVLRDAVGGARELVADGSTVAAVLDGLFADRPALRDRLSENGQLSGFVNVYVNDTDIRHRDGLQTKVSPDDVVILLPAMAGGCGTPTARLFTATRHAHVGAGGRDLAGLRLDQLVHPVRSRPFRDDREEVTPLPSPPRRESQGT